jgi:hypothetical protein
MRLILMKISALLIALVVIGAALLLPTYVPAQGRVNRRGLSMKSGKFINGHDARGGRFDGRGPKPKLLSLAGSHRRHRRHRGWVRRG